MPTRELEAVRPNLELLAETRVSGEVSVAELQRVLTEVNDRISNRRRAVLVDCSDAPELDAPARDVLLRWVRDHTPPAVAIVASAEAFRSTVSGISLLTEVPLRAFKRRREAESWATYVVETFRD